MARPASSDSSSSASGSGLGAILVIILPALYILGAVVALLQFQVLFMFIVQVRGAQRSGLIDALLCDTLMVAYLVGARGIHWLSENKLVAGRHESEVYPSPQGQCR
jgi:hypothetical protein